MAESISGIKGVPPSYPIKPVQPGPQDRKSGQRKKDQPRKDREVDESKDGDSRQGDDDGRSPSIDEYV